MTDARDAYDELGVSPTAEQAVIEAAYFALIKKYHPDHQGGAVQANARAQRLNAAWEAIGTEEKRRDYDARRAARLRPEPRPAGEAGPERAAARPHGRGARVSVARYFGRLRGQGEARPVGPGAIALIVLTLLLLGLWLADLVHYWNDPVPPAARQTR